jgi:hypothetical protein
MSLYMKLYQDLPHNIWKFPTSELADKLVWLHVVLAWLHSGKAAPE